MSCFRTSSSYVLNLCKDMFISTMTNSGLGGPLFPSLSSYGEPTTGLSFLLSGFAGSIGLLWKRNRVSKPPNDREIMAPSSQIKRRKIDHTPFRRTLSSAAVERQGVSASTKGSIFPVSSGSELRILQDKSSAVAEAKQDGCTGIFVLPISFAMCSVLVSTNLVLTGKRRERTIMLFWHLRTIRDGKRLEGSMPQAEKRGHVLLNNLLVEKGKLLF
ncbi:unnamed protein product [Citrullus colocynthis]|uniref:Uncharacterized protein n=1 Tax=Citrullus colocynthis TaxID=252529 RepID=A0ABP0Z5U3_9ROSI